MATENNKSKSRQSNTAGKSKKGKQRYLPYNKPVKKKGSYPLHPGVQGFFITCDGGRERQACHEAINVIDSFYEELVNEKDSSGKLADQPNKPLNKKIKFSYSESSSSSDEEDNDTNEEEVVVEEKGERNQSDNRADDNANCENSTEEKSVDQKDDTHSSDQAEEPTCNDKEDVKSLENQSSEAEEPPAKKRCTQPDVAKRVIPEKVEEKSIDRLIEAELEELVDRNKRRFATLDSGCNGVVFVQMRKRDGDPGPKDIVQHMMTSLASTRKHVSRFILRVLPVEVACYSSEEEISKAMKPLVEENFPVETQNPQKFAVLFESRANTGVDRMKIITAVAKSVPAPHKVDLNNPNKTIVVQIVKTVCLIGIIEKYKELSKYNLRQLTSPKP